MEDLNNVEEMIGVVEADNSVLSQEILEFVTAVEEDLYEIELDQAFPAVGEANEQLRHDNLTGRDEPDQHIITSISGLREELDSIEALQTFYSDKRGRADYYLWEDGNPQGENRVGYFVSLSSIVESSHDENLLGRITICGSKDEYNNIYDYVLGVTVDSAGFIGGQSDIIRDYRYGLVANTGIVAVQCELDVQVGDYVLSNYYGMAKKSPNGYGYKVVAIENVDGLDYAVISLNASMKNVSELADDLCELEDRVDKAETNVLSAMNVATEAYNLAINGGGGGSGSGGSIPEGLIQDVNDALQKSEDAMDTVNLLSSQITAANSAAVQAQQIAKSAVSSANAIRDEALAKANEALATVNTEIAAIQEEVDVYQSDINKSIQEFDGKVDTAISNIDNLDDKVDGLSVNIAETTSKIDETSASMQNLAALIDSHYVGTRSQAYGLSTAQIDEVLDAGMIYVPTIEHDEQYACNDAKFYTYSVMEYSPAYGYSVAEAPVDDDTVYIPTSHHVEAYVNDDGTEVRQNFIKGYAYTWNGNEWTESTSECVSFGDDNTYLYRYDEENNKLYVEDEDTLFLRDGYINQHFDTGYYYLWNGKEWEKSNECVYLGSSTPDNDIYEYWYADLDKITDGYYPKTLYFYKNNQWVAVAVLGENVTNRIVSLIQQSVDKNAAAIDLLVDYDKKNTETVSDIDLKANENSAAIQNITSYVNKHAVGDLSPADGFTIEEANDYFISDVYYVPIEEHRETYGEVTSNFRVGYLYTWNYNGWTESETKCVHHGVDAPTDVSYTYWYTGSDSVVEGYQEKTLYLKEDGVWVEVAKLNELITNTVASIRQKVNQNGSFIDLLANYKNKDTDSTAGILAAVSEHESELSAFSDYAYYDNGNRYENTAAFVQQVNKNKADIESLTKYDGELEDNIALIKQLADEDGASIQALAASLDQYSVGRYSQAYGLTYELAKELVKVGSIFVPTESNLKESYKNDDETVETEFIVGAYYEWEEDKNGNPYWYEYTNSVFHSNTKPTATESYVYWFNTNTVEEDGYIPKALYKWEEVTTESNETVLDWKLVALLLHNSLSRTVSSLLVTQDSIAIDVSSTKGDLAATKLWIDDNKAAIQDVVAWHGDNGESLVTFMEEAGDNFASAAQIAQVADKSGKVTAASIVAAVNGTTGDSIVQLKADHINFKGFTTFAKADDFKTLKESAISNTKIEYALSDSAKTVPNDDDWSTDSPIWTEGKYIWQRTTVKFVDDSKPGVVTTVCIQGAKGEQGNPGYTPQKGVDYFDGTDGKDGSDGKSVVKVTPEYYCSSDGTASSNNTDWKETPEDWESGNTVFVRYRVDYDSGEPTYTEPQRDETFTTISDWCVSSDKTLINGANIATGTLSASQIKTGVLRDPNHKFEINLDTGTITMGTSFSVNIIAGASTFIKAEGSDTYSPESITCTAQVNGVSDGTFTWYINDTQQGNETSSISVSPNHDGDIKVKVEYALDKDHICSDEITIKKIEIGIGDVEVNADIWEFVLDQPYITIPVDSDGNAEESARYTVGITGYKNGTLKSGASDKTSITNNSNVNAYFFEYDESQTVISSTDATLNNNDFVVKKQGQLQIGKLNYIMNVSSGVIPITFYYSNGSDVITVTKEIYIHASKEDAIIDSLSFKVGEESHGLNPANLLLAINNVGQSEIKLSADKIDINGVLNAAKGGKIGGWTINSNYIKTEGTGGTGKYNGSMELLGHDANINHWMRVFDGEGNMVFSIRRDGAIGATSGTIGGWTINTSSIYTQGTGPNGVTGSMALYSHSANTNDWIRITNGSDINKGSTMFQVKRNGTLIANEAEISGEVTATSGNIGGWTINTTSIITQGTNKNNYTGSMALYSHDAGTNDWIRITNGPTINDGETIFSVRRDGYITAKAGNIGGCTFDKSGNLIVPGNLVNGAVSSASSASSIVYGGTISDNVSFAGGSGYLVSGDGYARLTSPNQYAYVGVNNTTIYMRVRNETSIKTTLSLQNNGGNLSGTWTLNSSTAITSDRNKKNSIVDIHGSYENLFDNLHPVLFKYNDGTSGRVHTGFISQDVCEAIENANLTTDDFAAYVRYIHVDEETSEVEEIYTLRYDEFIALNTWQIQKCKKRIADLEAKIEELINRNEE